VLLVQEVRDADQDVADRLLEEINREANPRYAMVEGPRLGRTTSKEQYVVYYRPPVLFVDSFTVPDPDDRFEREPLVARFQAGGSTSGWWGPTSNRTTQATSWQLSRRWRTRLPTPPKGTSSCWAISTPTART